MGAAISTTFESLHGRITGRGSTTLVLSHGFGTDQSAWEPLRPWLDAHFRVASFDLAGCGPGGEASYDPRRHGSLYGYADDLITILDELQIRECIYVGHSASGMIGAAAATARPDLFRQLVMIGASPRYLNDEGYVGGFEQEDLNGVYGAMAANYQAWVAGFAPAVVGVGDHEAIADFSRTLFEMRPDIALSTLRTIFQSDLREVASRLERPTILLQTQKDMAVPDAVARWLHSHIDRSSLDIIEAEGHLPHMTAPDAIRQVLQARLAQPDLRG